ncbi:hypothetical protein B0T09DRAFT_164627 [Sordaria sp. MPI-SDFR-AT-0083]|nr:hypothetical protein B0T09DRAFT_164627 [Sordaria sp. MPI-SDFR-AT-0083]
MVVFFSLAFRSTLFTSLSLSLSLLLFISLSLFAFYLPPFSFYLSLYLLSLTLSLLFSLYFLLYFSLHFSLHLFFTSLSKAEDDVHTLTSFLFSVTRDLSLRNLGMMVSSPCYISAKGLKINLREDGSIGYYF